MQVKIGKIKEFKGHNGPVYALEKGEQDHLVYSGSSDKFVALWNLKRLESEKFAAQFPAIIYSICHIPEKNILLVGTAAGSIHILDLIKKEEIKILQHHTEPVFKIQYTIDHDQFYTVSGDGNFAICSLGSLSLLKIKKLCSEKIRNIDLNPNHKELAIACGDNTIRIYDQQKLEEKISFKAHEQSVNSIRYSPDGKLIFSGGKDAHLNIWDALSYTCIKSIPAHNFAIYDIVFSPDGKLVATASRDKTIKIWNAETFELLVRINKEKHEGHSNSVNKLLWSGYNNYLISTGDDRVIMVWKIDIV